MKEKVLSIFALFLLATMVMACQTTATGVVNNTETAANVNAAPAAADPASPTDDAPRITLAEAKAAYDAGTAVFVDTRSEASFKAEHIKGAINVHADMLEAKITQLPKDKKIIAYCSWPAEHTSASLVSELKKRGFDNGYAMVGGTAAWKGAGYPMDSVK